MTTESERLNMNNKSKYIFFGVVGILLTLGTLQACDLRQFVTVDAPAPVLESIDATEGSMTLAEADNAWKDWQYFVKSNTERFRTAIDDAEGRYATLHSFISVGLETGGDFANTIPYGGLIFGGLTGLAGLMLPQPKIVKKEN